jgi:hypothetical protein
VQVIVAVMGGDSSFHIDRERLKLLPRRAFIDLPGSWCRSASEPRAGARNGMNSFPCASMASGPLGGSEPRRREFPQVARVRTP